MLILIPTQNEEQAARTGELAVSLAGLECEYRVQVDADGEGFTKTVNRGITDYSGHICLLNDDCVPITQDWLAILKEEMDRRVPLGVWFAGPSGPCRTAPQNQGRIGDRRRPRIVDHLAGFCLLGVPGVFRLGLDEQFAHYGSDVDLQWRMRREYDKQPLWVPEVYVEHVLHEPHKAWWEQDQQKLRDLWE